VRDPQFCEVSNPEQILSEKALWKFHPQLAAIAAEEREDAQN
jgi:hypothetical protein